MKEKPYTILRQGVEPDGRTWADYINNETGQKGSMRVRAGLDLEDSIRYAVDFNRESRERIASMSPEELARLRRIGHEAQKRWDAEYSSRG